HPAPGSAAPAPRKWPIEEGPGTPKICLLPGDVGGPLPGNWQPPAPPQSRGPGGGYGGFLARKVETSPEHPGGDGRNPAEAYRRIRQLGVTHLVNVSIGGTPWTEERV